MCNPNETGLQCDAKVPGVGPGSSAVPTKAG